jgi:hypothetical protein
MPLIDPITAQPGDLVLVLNSKTYASTGPQAWGPAPNAPLPNPGAASIVRVAARPLGALAGYLANGQAVWSPPEAGIYGYRTP